MPNYHHLTLPECLKALEILKRKGTNAQKFAALKAAKLTSTVKVCPTGNYYFNNLLKRMSRRAGVKLPSKTKKG